MSVRLLASHRSHARLAREAARRGAFAPGILLAAAVTATSITPSQALATRFAIESGAKQNSALHSRPRRVVRRQDLEDHGHD